MSASAAIVLALIAVLVPGASGPGPVAAAPEDALAVAHRSGERTHAISAFKVESAIESLNKGTMQVFGTRRELKCPGGGQVTESSCSPCTFKSSEWPDRPADAWIVDVSWVADDEAAHAAAMRRLDHYRKHFDLEPRGGSEKGGRRYVFFELKGARPVIADEGEVVSLRLLVGGRDATLALIPLGKKEVEIEAQALRRSGSGELAPAPDAEVRFEASSCASVVASGPRSARAVLHPTVERCELRAVAAGPGKASSSIVLRRELALFITCEGQRADKLVLQGANVIDLSFDYEPAAKPAPPISPSWTAEGGKLEVSGNGRSVRLRLLPSAAQARVTLLDQESGASTTVTVKRPLASSP